MYQSMVNIQPAAAEIRRGKKKKIEGKKLQGKNIMAPLLHRVAIMSKATHYTAAIGLHKDESSDHRMTSHDSKPFTAL